MTDNKAKIMVISLGCDKNLVDSEMMLGILDGAGFEIVDDETNADVIVVNTCCFINDAKEESIQTLIECGELKKSASLKCLIATGCLAQRYADEIKTELPEVDAIIGTTSFDKVAETARELLEGMKPAPKLDDIARLVSGKPRILSTGGHFAYLKIAEGCDKNCSYCIIPKIRGPYRSVPMETLLTEAKSLSDRGVKELILVAQETTVYGVDLYGKKSLPELLRKVRENCDFHWIRILYGYPEEIDTELIKEMAENPKVCHYIDMPIQHSEDGILKRMGRRTSRADLVRVINGLRSSVPDICIRTTLITGFPGETEEDFLGLREFVKEMKFDRLGVFTYSREEGTGADKMPDQVPDEIKEARRDEIMALQQEIVFEKNENRCGQVLDCIVEGRIPEDNILVCRSYMDAPNVDGFVFVETDMDPMSGTPLKVKITGADGYDLIGVICTEA
ncbi:MAG: 30S ribosomal protein S12 methylthiotransferase RimO [Lachnospiraceae bacterium]|nr:30S ribosomal protein S12 methylthiotransferase RimO [Lachnospiraceae bacterium]